MTGRVAAVLLLLAAADPARAADALWGSKPYRVAIELDSADAGLPSGTRERLERRLLDLTRERMGAFWQTTFDSTTDGAPPDKSFTCRVERGPGGLVLSVRERDHTLALDAPAAVAPVAGVEDLPERLFCTIAAAFRPLARFQRDPEVAGRVTLAYRAAELAPAARLAVVRERTLLTPFQLRLGRDGAPSAGGAEPVRWTYLRAEPVADAAPPGAEVISHSRLALGGRPNARVEQLAIAAPYDPHLRTTLRLHAVGRPDEPLPGYEVLVGDAGRKAVRSLGVSDSAGLVPIPGGEGVVFAHVRCGTLFVARVPVAPGVSEVVTAPLVDERSRLRAELEVTGLRERLIDTVARRKILGERIKRALDEERVEAAAGLARELDGLPGRTQFIRDLDQAQRAAVAPHPIAQKRLDGLFDRTRQVVSAALDPRELRDIALAIARASKQETAAGGDGADPADGAESPSDAAPSG